MSDIEKYADKSMFPAAEMKDNVPHAYLLSMTEDPLGACAAAVRMYKGIPTYSLSDISDTERKEYFEAVFETELKAPFEFIKMHFMIEGVDRAFTHQMVRQRTAVYAQESLRFAVKENLGEAISRPPSLADPKLSHSKRNDLNDTWDNAIDAVQDAYGALIANGVPAEDARGLLPQATLTRLNYCTDARNFMAEAGKRLCTQAQFHWRAAFLSMREAVRTYGYNRDVEILEFGSSESQHIASVVHHNAWQFELIADSQIFSPVCYQLGKCGFKAEFDRGCSIRDRVDFFESKGVPSSKWDDPDAVWGASRAIDYSEWLNDPKAAWS